MAALDKVGLQWADRSPIQINLTPRTTTGAWFQRWLRGASGDNFGSLTWSEPMEQAAGIFVETR